MHGQHPSSLALHVKSWVRVVLWLLLWMTMLTAGISMAQMSYEFVLHLSSDSALERAMWHGVFAVVCLVLFVVITFGKSFLGTDPLFGNSRFAGAAAHLAQHTGIGLAPPAAPDTTDAASAPSEQATWRPAIPLQSATSNYPSPSQPGSSDEGLPTERDRLLPQRGVWRPV